MTQGWKALLLVAGILLSASAQTAPPDGKGGRPVLDQFNTGLADSSINGGTFQYAWQQGVTVGISGQLTRIDLYVRADATPASTELSVSLGPPWQSGTPAWSAIVYLVPGWNTINLAKEKIFMQAGDEFVIGVHGQSPDGASIFDPGINISYGDRYPGGDLYLNGSLNSYVNDMMFRTYVKQSIGKGD